MKNPWLSIPLSDYEAHMALPEVAQAQMLADVFAGQLDIRRPGSLAVIGCAGGNGFDRIAPELTRRVVGVDLNGRYLDEVRQRYAARFEQLELVEADIQAAAGAFAPVDLIYAALVLEYVAVEPVVMQLSAMLNPGGALVTVVQLPDANLPAVTPSSCASLETLEAVMHFVAPKDLRINADCAGLRQIASAKRRTPSGRQFQVQVFRPR
jgi:ubiquinone/menaquinone biosynthesis C-methylase UbiE